MFGKRRFEEDRKQPADPKVLFENQRGYVAAQRRLLDIEAALFFRQTEETQLHESSSASSRKIGCIHAGASLMSLMSSRRFSAGSVRFRCWRRSAVTFSLPSSRRAWIRRPLSRPAAAMFFAVVCRSSTIIDPIFTVRLGP